MLVKLFRFFFGYVIFEGICNYPSKFMNIAVKSNLNIWKISCSNCQISAYIRCSEYKYIRKIARTTGLKVKIVEKHGLPFIIKKYSYRKGIIIGIPLFFVIIHILSLFAWKIEIGETKVTKDEILTALENIGVTIGTPIKSLDSNLIEQSLMNSITSISWCSVNIKGSVIQVETKETDFPPVIETKDIPSNLISVKDAQITRTEVYGGSILVKSGDVVLQDQILVSGEVKDDMGGVTLKRSYGKVYAMARKNIEVVVPLSKEEKIYTEAPTIRKKLLFGNISIPITFSPLPNSEYEISQNENNVNLFGIELPISLYSEYVFPLKKEIRELNTAEAENSARSQLAEIESTQLKDVKVYQKDESYKIENGNYSLNISYLCEENIAVEVPLQSTQQEIEQITENKFD